MKKSKKGRLFVEEKLYSNNERESREHILEGNRNQGHAYELLL